jgi:hypothetical protein
MHKFKLVLSVILVVVLIDFALENKALPTPELKLFTFTLGRIPTFLLAYVSLALGFVAGWFSHVLRVRKQKRLAAVALAQEQPAQPSQ